MKGRFVCGLESVAHVLREPGLPEEDTGPAQPDLAICVIHTLTPLGSAHMRLD